MRILFMGTPGFALPSLNILLDHRYDIAGVVTAPDKPRGRGQRVSPGPVKQLAVQRGLPVYQPEQLRDPAFVSTVQFLRPDLIVVVAFRILPLEIFTLAKRGAFNLHASLLPKYRGAAPINWAVINGETETGVTTFFLKEKVDTGAVILQARVNIGPDETAGELHDKLAEVGAEIVLQTVRLIELGKAVPREQDETRATPAPKISKEDCRIRWERPAQMIHNLVRGLSPSPAAWTTHRGTQLRIFRTSLDIPASVARGHGPGEVLQATRDILVVHTGAGSLVVRELQQEGRRRMSVEEFLRGYRIATGDRFE